MGEGLADLIKASDLLSRTAAEVAYPSIRVAQVFSSQWQRCGGCSWRAARAARTEARVVGLCVAATAYVSRSVIANDLEHVDSPFTASLCANSLSVVPL